MKYSEEDYYMDINECTMDEINAAFDIKDVLEDFYGVDDMKRSGEGYRCSCPIHGGSNPGAMAVYTNKNVCHSFTEQRTFNVIGLMNYLNHRGDERNVNSINKKKCIFELCNFYGIDPENIPGLYKREIRKTVEKEEKTFIEKKEPEIYLSPAMLKIFGMRKNPFENPVRLVKTDRKIITQAGKEVYETKRYVLNDKEASYLVYEGLKRFARAMNIITKSGDAFLKHSKMYSENPFLFSGSFSKLLHNVCGWYKAIEEKCKEIGFEKPPKDIIRNEEKNIDKDMHIKIYESFGFDELGYLNEEDYLEYLNYKTVKCVEMDERDIPEYIDFGKYTHTITYKKEDITVFNGKAFCPTKEDYLAANERRLFDWQEEIKNFKTDFQYISNFIELEGCSDGLSFETKNDIVLINSLISAEEEITNGAFSKIKEERMKDSPIFMIDINKTKNIEDDEDYDRE